MFQKVSLSVGFLFWVSILSAQVQSPQEFLGYKIGTRYTPHHKIVSYYQQVAANATGTVKLEQYGETNEGRPLLLAYISSPENLKNLESIRLNNLRLANVAKDRMAPAEENAPAIVWLSYNVHGNEPASSEAALLTLYALADPANNKTKEWLKNTVVILDPCLNPDGRDRYVNWYNSAVGKEYNPNPIAREHREPWPAGRTNHYNFDLNRDWAWQTQMETRYRIKKYLEWMPQVHVDYHEQGINEPYYFAPAAEPYHEVITPWQREFQHIIGKNNAKYFDGNGWLFFTKIRFDLFYPAYGDTYPTYNGAIGMTYEQGGISGGLGVINEDGDTLTLADRAQHHFTTSLSTIEASSLNAGKLIKEFRNYFNNAVANGTGEYKAFIIKNEPRDAQRIDKLLDLMEKNGIRFSTGTGTIKVYNYQSGKEESITIGNNDIVISTYQPRSAMVKVLFEPKSKLSDSATYDITAWSLPYVYGLTAFASKEKVVTGGPVARTKANNTTTEYGYVLPWNGVRTVKAVGQLMKKGVLLRYSEVPFEVNGNKFDRGAILILKTSNQEFGSGLWSMVRSVADDNNLQLYPVTTGMVDKGFDFGSDMIHPLKAPRIVLITGDAISTTAAGGIWSFFEQELDYPITQVSTNDVQRIDWSKVDVLIMPDGNHKYLNEKDIADNLKEWISKGGNVVALESAVAQLAKADIAFKAKKSEEADKKEKDKSAGYDALNNYEERERDALSDMTAGSIYRIELDNTHPLAFGYAGYYYTLKQDDYLYEFITGKGWNVGVIKKDNQVAGFVGANLKNKLKDGMLYGVQQVGNGTVTCLSDDVIFRNFWENGKLLFCNAVFLVGQ
ncbi:MAG TPA: M14 family metallopeptidase [Chitinophagaceae bacterium]|nr:M14 family metallopeptidase [Chitinophagaceae bacterium]